MWWILPLLFLVYGAFAIRLRQRRFKLWLDTVGSCGLKVVDRSSQTASLLRIEARAEPGTVRIEAPGSRKTIRVTAAFPGPPGFAGVTIRREADRPPGTREIEVGDEIFDSTFSIEGPARLLSALLDEETRRLLVRVNAGSRLEISGGEIRLDMLDKDLPDVLPPLLDFGRRLAQPVPIAHRLAENARRDPEAGVRLSNLTVLAREFPKKPGTAETLRAACTDASPQVRLRAAMEIGARGHDVLVELAESPEDDACAAQAIARLGRKLPLERTRAILTSALETRRLQTACACLEALGRSGDAAAVEAPLLQALQREDVSLRVAAANALARTGTAAAVLPLQEAAESSRDQELRRATRQAVAEIQSRLQGASPGQLSVAESEAGQLSLASSEIGQLSLAVEPFPLPPEEPEHSSRREREGPAAKPV